MTTEQYTAIRTAAGRTPAQILTELDTIRRGGTVVAPTGQVPPPAVAQIPGSLPGITWRT